MTTNGGAATRTTPPHSHLWQEIPPLDVQKLSSYAPVFFFRNIGRFLGSFLLLTIASLGSTVAAFASVALLGDLVSNIMAVEPSTIFTFYLPVFLGLVVIKESLDFATRRYGEAFPTIYADYLTLRMYRSLLMLRSSALLNISPQTVVFLVTKYVGHVQKFLEDWFWVTSRRITSFVIIVFILYHQSLGVLLFNLVYFAIFLAIALHISRRFAPIAQRYAEQDLLAGARVGSFIHNLPSVRRLGAQQFFESEFQTVIGEKWLELTRLRSFHALRWLLQLLLYNSGYIVTLAYGAYQVRTGTLPLGYLVLIKYAFDNLSLIFIYIIEYYVALIQQRGDATVMRDQLAAVLSSERGTTRWRCDSWANLSLREASITFNRSAASGADISISAPLLSVRRGEKIGIIGPSGIGKTSLLHTLLNLIPFDGHYLIDDRSVKGTDFDPRFISMVTTTDPLFNLSLRDNITLGAPITESQLLGALTAVCADFATELDARVGSPNFNLSAGQQQRIRLARGLLQRSEIFLLDEPFNGIDDTTKSTMLLRLKEHLADQTVVLVTHNSDELSLVDRIYQFENGILSERPKTAR